MAKFFNWKVDKIYIYPLGGITIFDDKINKPFIEELLVTIMGPVFQIIITIFLYKYEERVLSFSKMLLVFNLLPIVPLDGGRLLNLILFLKIPYKKSIELLIRLSFINYFLVVLFTIYKKESLFFLVVLLFFIFKIIEEARKTKYYFNRFIVERLLYNFKFKKNIIIKKLDNIYKYMNNYLNIDNKLYHEKEYINEMYVKNNKTIVNEFKK